METVFAVVVVVGMLEMVMAFSSVVVEAVKAIAVVFEELEIAMPLSHCPLKYCDVMCQRSMFAASKCLSVATLESTIDLSRAYWVLCKGSQNKFHIVNSGAGEGSSYCQN